MSDMAKFYAEMATLEEEREAAYAGRNDSDEGRERWSKAKHAYEEFRSFMRAQREATDAQAAATAEAETPDASVTPEAVQGKTGVNKGAN